MEFVLCALRRRNIGRVVVGEFTGDNVFIDKPQGIAGLKPVSHYAS